MPEMVITIPAENVGDSTNEMVLTDLKLLNLSPLTPILVKGFQELDNEVAAQNEEIGRMQHQIDSLLAVMAICCQSVEPSFRTNGSGSHGIQGNWNNDYILFQNDPNPFQYSTEIRYSLPSEVDQAEILILNMNGRVVKRIPIIERESEGAVTIYSSDLNSSIYSYSLVVNGHVIETKKMVCSK